MNMLLPDNQVGACVVNPDHKIVGIGHNAPPESRGCAEQDFPHWEKRDIDKDGFENTKYAYGKSYNNIIQRGLHDSILWSRQVIIIQ